MTAEQIFSLGPALSRYLDEFKECFGSFDTRRHLKEYVIGQLSDLPRKSVEPMAHLAEVAPRTLQEFLSLSHWDHERLRQRVQQIVARDHADEQAIGIVDESGHPKKGNKTACVQRQYCGNTGKIDNCVMSVHLCYASSDNSLRTMIDSELFLPEKSWADAGRRAEAQIPDSVLYRAKHQIALELLERAVGNGVRLGWVTADEWYSEKPAFLAGLERMNLRFVLEIPRNLMGWLHEPSEAGEDRSEAQMLCRYSRVMMRQPWTRYHIKETDKGPMVWEAKATAFWMLREGQVVGPYWLIVARDVLNPDQIKYFLSNAAAGVPIEPILHVAFSRWPIERCLQDEKTELGLSHFECRKYVAVHRHLLITQVSHLFLARQCQRLRGEKPAGHHLPGSNRQRCADRHPGVEPARPASTNRSCGQNPASDPGAQHRGTHIPRQGPAPKIAEVGNPRGTSEVLHPAMTEIAL
jgi:SRSO17 transposase